MGKEELLIEAACEELTVELGKAAEAALIACAQLRRGLHAEQQHAAWARWMAWPLEALTLEKVEETERSGLSSEAFTPQPLALSAIASSPRTPDPSPAH